MEVQLPFLQAGLGEFRLVPLVCGRVDPKVVADVLAKRIGPQDVVIASSDLSHYHPYEAARSLDLECVRRIRELDIRGMQQQEACGKTPILVLMHLARQFDWEPILLSYQNSGDTSGRKEGSVVGYAANCPSANAQRQDPLSPKAKKGGGGDGVNPLPNDDRSTTSPTDGTTQPLTVEEGPLAGATCATHGRRGRPFRSLARGEAGGIPKEVSRAQRVLRDPDEAWATARLHWPDLSP